MQIVLASYIFEETKKMFENCLWCLKSYGRILNIGRNYSMPLSIALSTRRGSIKQTALKCIIYVLQIKWNYFSGQDPLFPKESLHGMAISHAQADPFFGNKRVGCISTCGPFPKIANNRKNCWEKLTKICIVQEMERFSPCCIHAFIRAGRNNPAPSANIVPMPEII